MKNNLRETYEKFMNEYGFKELMDYGCINKIIKESIQRFLQECENPAIYCNGVHTRMLMSDFIFELKKVKYIVDNYSEIQNDGGFYIIRDEELEEKAIDGVIISTYIHRNKILQSLAERHSRIKYLDFYEELEKNGIYLNGNYYSADGMHGRYRTINILQRKLREGNDDTEQLYENILNEYLQIKDFHTAILVAEKYHEKFPGDRTLNILQGLKEIYELEKEAIASISDKNVLMLCIDGLRRDDFTRKFMPKLTADLAEDSYIFQNAYAVSTSTFESLCPAYSGNDDLRTRYYENNAVLEKDCSFVMEAKNEGRNIYFYTNADQYIVSDWIHYRTKPQTIMEKFWCFLMDAIEEENGLFYIHAAESHFTFSNPYTMDVLLAEGMAMIYDFLPVKGGKLRADYKKQHADAVRYLDDVMAPLLGCMLCRMVLYADHGNMLLDKECKLEDVPKANLTCGEELIRIPYIIKSPEMGKGVDDTLISLKSIGDIVVSLLRRQPYRQKKAPFIKILRSQIYNPDMKKVYEMRGEKQSLKAFEAFIFPEGLKLMIYEDGTVELWTTEIEDIFNDPAKKIELLEKIKTYITVVPTERLKMI